MSLSPRSPMPRRRLVKKSKGMYSLLLFSLLLLYGIFSEFQVFNFSRDRRKKRDVFLTNLKAEGLTIDRRLKHLENGLIVQFDLITAGDRMLETYAEILQLRMPLKRDEKVENLELMRCKGINLEEN